MENAAVCHNLAYFSGTVASLHHCDLFKTPKCACSFENMPGYYTLLHHLIFIWWINAATNSIKCKQTYLFNKILFTSCCLWAVIALHFVNKAQSINNKTNLHRKSRICAVKNDKELNWFYHRYWLVKLDNVWLVNNIQEWNAMQLYYIISFNSECYLTNPDLWCYCDN